MSAEDALRAQNDQLLSFVRDALHLVNVKALGVVCPACGAKVGRSCYGNGPMAVPHGGRTNEAQAEVRRILLAALETGVKL
jgi:hypothetical protein